VALAFLDKLESYRPFTEHEAWGLFRAVAISEAVGWTILIAGLAISHYRLPGSRYSVPIAGQIHGTIFLIYFGVLIVVYSSLRWSRKKFLLAAVAGVPPYGTLIFEQWASRRRKNQLCRAQFNSIVLTVLLNRLSYKR
jgi:integral membrane protein